MNTRKLFLFNIVVLSIAMFELVLLISGDRTTQRWFVTTLVLFFSGMELVRAELKDLRRAIATRDEVKTKPVGS